MGQHRADVNTARDHVATLLPDGRVLVVGGHSWVSSTNYGAQTAPQTSAEIYDPETGMWRSTSGLSRSSFYLVATPLAHGEVLITSGPNFGEGVSTEVFDSVSERWRRVENPRWNRWGGTTTLLKDGRVLLSGGESGGAAIRTAELYDPRTESWSTTSATNSPLMLHASVLLPNGSVLAIGNRDCARIAEIYDPVTGQWAVTQNAPLFGCIDAAVLLNDGKVLVTTSLQSQLFNPDTQEWHPVAGAPSVGSRHRLTLLPTGVVLATGGGWDRSTDAVDIFDPATMTWTPGPRMSVHRCGHTATLLNDGNRVLVTGGYEGYCCDWRTTHATAELLEVPMGRSTRYWRQQKGSRRASILRTR
jgi:hypothetical protein